MQTLPPVTQLTATLIEKASVTPDDAGCQAFMMQYLAPLGFEHTPLRFGEVDNFFSVTKGTGPILCFAGHTDVVPTGPSDNWQFPPFEPTLKDGMLYGRGAADMKGSLAAMLIASKRCIEQFGQPTKGRLAYLITSDEEGPAADGTVKVVKWLQDNNIHLNYCLVGEPSSTNELGDIIKNGRRGSLGCVLTAHGIQGHIAYPHLAKNPILDIAPALAELGAEHWDSGNAFFPATSFQVSNITSGTGATNVIPGTLEMVFNFRFSTELTADVLIERTEAILQKHKVNFSANWHLSGEPFITERGPLIDATVAAIKQCTGRKAELSTSGGTSDGRFIAKMGGQVIELGPRNDTIHKIDECVSSEDLESLADVYQAIIKRLLY